MLMFLSNSYAMWFLLLQGALHCAYAISLVLDLRLLRILKLRMIPGNIFVAQFF